MMDKQLDLNIEKIQRYNLRIPRYTSYPTVPNWGNQDFTADTYQECLTEASTKDSSLSLYIHIPFCIRRCLFCGCNTIITQKEERVRRYIHYLKKEIDLVVSYLGTNRKVEQLHLGGGTPTHLKPVMLEDVMVYLHQKFEFQENAEKSIEVHPSVTSIDHLDVLRSYQFSRLSMGVQDFTPEVQKKLNRHQTFKETAELIDYARHTGYNSINVDLIYGLPYQTAEGFADTLDKIKQIQPDRLAMYSYAHFPKMFKHHQGIPLAVIPQGRNKLHLFLDARKTLLDAGYHQVGFDHFALETDELWESYQDQTLRRNFMGYTTKAGTDLIAFGWSGISELSTGYAQNSKDMNLYEHALDVGRLPISKGYRMTQDDISRKQIIMNILCQNEVNITKIEEETGWNLSQYQQIVLNKMPKLEAEGFVTQQEDGWKLTKEGQIFARVVAASFDAFFSNDHVFSMTV